MAIRIEELKPIYTKREIEPELSKDEWAPKSAEICNAISGRGGIYGISPELKS